MRVSIFLICIFALSVQAQVSFGPNGMNTTPINLLTVFRFVRSLWNSYFYPDELNKELKEEQITSKFDKICQGSACKEEENNGKFDVESKTFVIKVDSDAEEPEKIITPGDDKTGQLVVNKWSLIYVVIITMLFWPFMVLATPYYFTGIPLRRDDNEWNYEYFNNDDILLLLSWLLGEVSDDRSCLEAVVCRSAPRSSQYITLTSTLMNVAKFFRGWLPYSERIDSTIRHLGGVANTGLYEGCNDFYCQDLPDPEELYYYHDYNDVYNETYVDT